MTTPYTNPSPRAAGDTEEEQSAASNINTEVHGHCAASPIDSQHQSEQGVLLTQDVEAVTNFLMAELGKLDIFQNLQKSARF